MAKRMGRPPKGPDGSTVRAMPALTVRLPVPTMARLRALGKLACASPSEIVAHALAREFDAVAGEDARTLGALASREAARLRKRYPEQ